MEQPWISNPYWLISWWDMLEFSAERFYMIGVSLRIMVATLDTFEGHEKIGDPTAFSNQLGKIIDQCAPIGLADSTNLAKRIQRRIDANWTGDTLKAWVESLDEVIRGESRKELFLWVPTERASYYGKTAEELLGGQCLDRFRDSRIDMEAVEAMHCYALGRFTASAFHITRMGEAAVRAFALAIGHVVKNHNWGSVFVEYDRQYNLKPQDRPAHWQVHGDFLVGISGDLKAMQKTWRNGVVHLDATYSAEQAEYLLRVVPVFIRHVATRLDEKGVLYPPP